MQDSSPFRWLEERGPACQLIAVIDDATGRFYARLTEHDTSEENLCAGLRGAQVEIERRLDGSHWIRFRGGYLRLRHCLAPLQPSASPSGLRPPGLGGWRTLF